LNSKIKDKINDDDKINEDVEIMFNRQEDKILIEEMILDKRINRTPKVRDLAREKQNRRLNRRQKRVDLN